MEAILNLVWDYQKGVYVSERHAPLRYRARRFLEKRVIPAARKVAATVRTVAGILAVAALLLLTALGNLGQWGVKRLARYPHHRCLSAIEREVLRGCEGMEKIFFSFLFVLPITAAYMAAVAGLFLLAGFFLLAGKGARKVLARFGLDFDEVTRP
ncbi:hypothetical protein [Desulfofundulus thermocisternus]|uniref:hypothetical protein n=1 Tax=Desulfofundulus thermocisternus TaxID=42471 RepID=UPI000A88A6EB|nr:hypothetical protein [Desulfofundulus thermocisternus]